MHAPAAGAAVAAAAAASRATACRPRVAAAVSTAAVRTLASSSASRCSSGGPAALLQGGGMRQQQQQQQLAVARGGGGGVAQVQVQVRHSTIWRKVQEGIQDKQAQKEDEQFQAELQRLANLDKYDLVAFKDAMDNAEKGSWFSWVNKMPGVRSMPEVQMGERYKKILGALRAEELARPELIQSRVKLRIAAETGETVQEINQLLALYDNSRALHKWVRRRVQDKKELPRTRSECQVLMMGDPAGISVSSFQQKQQKRAARRGGRLPF